MEIVEENTGPSKKARLKGMGTDDQIPRPAKKHRPRGPVTGDQLDEAPSGKRPRVKTVNTEIVFNYCLPWAQFGANGGRKHTLDKDEMDRFLGGIAKGYYNTRIDDLMGPLAAMLKAVQCSLVFLCCFFYSY